VYCHSDIIDNKTKLQPQKIISVNNTISAIYKTFYNSDRTNGNKIAIKQSSK